MIKSLKSLLYWRWFIYDIYLLDKVYDKDKITIDTYTLLTITPHYTAQYINTIQEWLFKEKDDRFMTY